MYAHSLLLKHSVKRGVLKATKNPKSVKDPTKRNTSNICLYHTMSAKSRVNKLYN